MKRTAALLGLLLIAGYCAIEAHGFESATAIIGLNNVAGWIRFFTFETNGTIEVNLVGLSENVTWRVHEYPVDLTIDPAVRCTRDYLGDVYTTPSSVSGDLSGTFEEIDSNPRVIVIPTLDETPPLRGADSIVGRSLLINEGGESVACATIRSKAEEVEQGDPRLQAQDAVTLQATFTSPVAGTVYFRQTGEEDIMVYGKLYYVDGVTGPTFGHEWRIFDELGFSNGSGSGVYRVGNCGGIMERFDPTGANSSRPAYPSECTTTTPGGCEIGDLSGKFGGIPLSNRSQPFAQDAFIFTDTTFQSSNTSNLSLTSIELLTLAVHSRDNPDMILACAPILRAEGIEALQYSDFTNFRIYQNSPYENTTLILGSGFSDNSASILEAAWMPNGLCPANEPLYNPFDVAVQGEQRFTPDLFPIGNLSGKYPLRAGENLEVTEMPLYGANTVLSRTFRSSLVTPDYRSCSALVPLKDDNAVLLQANFVEGPIRGAIYFIQRVIDTNNNAGVTNIVVDLYYNDPDMGVTTGHNWHVHLFPPQSGMECVDVIGDHFNPFNVDNDSNIYDMDCNKITPLRCESGDLSNKHGQLTLGPLSPTRITYSYIDTNLQLTGVYGILGRSIGLHLPSAQGGALFACAEIQKTFAQEIPNDAVAAIPVSELTSFDRVDFTSTLANAVDFQPANVLLLREEVGMLTTEDGAPCAVLEMRTTASTVEQADTYAGMIQEEVCNRYSANPCMQALSNIDTLCPVPSTGPTQPDGAGPSAALLSQGVMLLSLLLSVLLASLLL